MTAKIRNMTARWREPYVFAIWRPVLSTWKLVRFVRWVMFRQFAQTTVSTQHHASSRQSLLFMTQLRVWNNNIGIVSACTVCTHTYFIPLGVKYFHAFVMETALTEKFCFRIVCVCPSINLVLFLRIIHHSMDRKKWMYSIYLVYTRSLWGYPDSSLATLLILSANICCCTFSSPSKYSWQKYV